MRFFSRFILRRAGLISLLGTLLAFVGAYYSVLLYKNLRTNFEELLPTSARAVIDLKEVKTRLLSIENLGVLIFSDHPKESKRFVMDLADRLNRGHEDIISSVEYQIGPEIKYFKDRQALYMEVGDLKVIRDYIGSRIEYEKELYNPLNIFSERQLDEPKLDLAGIKKKYQKELGSYDRFPGGFYATPDEKKRAVLVYMAGESSIEKNIKLKHLVEKTIAELNPKSYAPDLDIRYTGGVQDTIEEHEALIADLELSTIIVMILTTVVMLVFFRTIRATMALVFSLFMGTLWTFGASYFAVGYLNANSAFLGGIVIGNGINFGIIFLARYLEERRQGRDNAEAIESSMSHTATQTWTAALAAGLSYGSLMLTGFRGFNQFGVIGLIGMVLCWLSAFTLLPAYLTVLDRFKPLVRPGSKPPKPFVTEALATLIDRYPKILWTASVVVTVVSLAMFGRFNSGILETDLSQLRNRESLERGSAYQSRYLDEIFQRYLSPLVILPKTYEETAQVAALLREKKAQQGKSTLIASVQTLQDFVPKQQKEKIKLLREIQDLLTPRIMSLMSPEDQQLVREFLTPVVFEEIGLQDLPKLVLNKFTEKDGSIGKLVLIEPPLSKDTWDGNRLVDFVHDLRGIADQVRPGTAVAGSLTITADMVSAISIDGPRATIFALIAVTLLVVVLFRNLKTASLILFALAIGMIWLAGIILGFWLKINFLNFIALPITFGIGVDYGVNIFQRYREEGGRDIMPVIRHTGGAVILCSLTTVIGYSSLLIAGNKGFVSFGLLAVLGEATCLIAAIISLPAFLRVRQGVRSDSVS